MHATLQNDVFVDRFTAPTPIGKELVTGPIATNTYQVEVIGVGGLLGLAAVNAIMSVDGVDCRNLNTYSYATAVANATSGVATLTSKDANGATVMNPNGQPPGVVPCTTAVGP